MFNYNAFMPQQNVSPPRPLNTKNLQNFSPAFIPSTQPIWTPVNNNSPFRQPSQENDETPNISRPLTANEDAISSSSSDSEQTDIMPEVSGKVNTSSIKDWDFGQGETIRRKSELLPATNSILPKTNNFPGQEHLKSWKPRLAGNVSVKPVQFGPLNTAGYTQTDKRAYFVIVEGFNIVTGQKIFKIEKLCNSLQARANPEENEEKQFLYMNLWSQEPQTESENIFEPLIYAVPHIHFRLAVTVYMTHAYEDPHTFEYVVDLRQFGFPAKEKRTQNMEVVYTEPGNNITLHAHLTNEKVNNSPGFPQKRDKQDQALEYNVILRQILIGLPLRRNESPRVHTSPTFFNSEQNLPRPNEVYVKRGSAITLGQEPKSSADWDPSSPISWSNFTPESSPQRVIPNSSTLRTDPERPPGMLKGDQQGSDSQSMPGGSLFKFKNQPRYSIQPVKRESEEVMHAKKVNRIQSTDLSVVLEGDKSPLKILEAYVNAVKTGNRRTSTISERSSNLGRGQHYSASAFSETEYPSRTTLISSYNSVAEIGEIQEEESPSKEGDAVDEFKIEDYIGKISDFARTYQGSKLLQKYVTTIPNKEALNIIIQEMGEKISEHILDPYANYMIQTLMQNGLPQQKLYLLQKMAPYFATIARDKKGTHSLQAILAHVNTPEEYTMIKTILGGSILDLCMDSRANYVIQKLINTIPVESSNFLYQPLFDNFVQLANNSFGLLVLKQMMQRVEQKETLKQKVVELTCLHFEKLIQNPYGNYAIQHIIEFYPKESQIILSKIISKIIPYSSQKISSNVIEKCLAVCDTQFRRRVVEEVLKNGRLGDLLKNKYGNFVTLQLLACASNVDKQRLMQETFRCANSFNGTKYKMRWLNFVQQNPLKINWDTNMIINQDEKEAVETSETYAEKLEAVKRIWRDMTKEEKNEGAPYYYNNKSPVKKNYN